MIQTLIGIVNLIAVSLALWVLARKRQLPWQRPIDAPAPVNPNLVYVRAKELCAAQEGTGLGLSGERKRHLVYAQLLKDFPTHPKRAVSRAIEDSLPPEV